MTTSYHPSDAPIPPRAAILDRASELRESAVRQNDAACVRQIDRLIVSVACGARMAWDRGVLLVMSLNTPGNVYRVRCGQCSCTSRKPCWHAALYETLVDMIDTEAVTADMDAEARMARKITAARASYARL